ncbi:LysR substrate-binding domain-containing protein [Ideonella sp. DXS29W]|uniref:LysR substrate-binding domain-containing protein n=1 Tax=Ideonella lacteola TaxID=2984193 RepID=A0ABU9BL61_9BURK
MNITFRQIRVFVEVARQGSVARAAEALHLTAPAVSLQIKEVESQVGQVLFDRAGRRMGLTTAGEYFLVYAKRLLATLKDAEDAMARFTRLESGRLTIGMVSAATYFLPLLLAKFRAEYPAVDVRLRLGSRDQLGVMMQANEVDLCIMGRAPRDLPTRAEPFAMHPHVLVVSPQHRFARAEAVPVAALASEPFIVREPESGTREALQGFFDSHHIQPTYVMEMPSNEAIKQAVMAGMGISILSLHTIALEWANELIAAPAAEGLPLVRRWNVVNTAAKHLSPAAEAFRYFVLEHGEAHLASMFGGEFGLGARAG